MIEIDLSRELSYELFPNPLMITALCKCIPQDNHVIIEGMVAGNSNSQYAHIMFTILSRRSQRDFMRVGCKRYPTQLKVVHFIG